MGEKSDSKKVSSPYVVLENRPLDQWKVTELKEELKKRKLMTKGLKEDLIKRLDEAVRAEMDEAKINLEEDLNNEVQSDDATVLPAVSEKTTNVIDTVGKNEVVEKDNTVEEPDNEKHDNRDVEMGMDIVQGHDGLQGDGGIVSSRVESFQVVQEISGETTILASEGTVSGKFCEKELKTVGNQNKDELLDEKPMNGESNPESESPEEEQTKPGSSKLDEVSQVQSVSISIDTVSNTERNEQKDNVIIDDVKLELDVKPLFTNMDLDGSKSESIEKAELLEGAKSSIEVVEPLKDTGFGESGDVGSSEKLNLDRSSGDDSMEEDALESKQIDSKFSSEEVGDVSEKTEVALVKEDDSIHVTVDDVIADKDSAPSEDKTDPNVASTKRKNHDQEAAQNSEAVKRQRRWNSEGLKVPEQQFTNRSASTTPKDAFQPAAKRTFSRSESMVSQESPKERVVPPSAKPPTTSLRIDNFLRPFTLKAVQELLGKTGTVVSFWMDHIKTHCYVTYASVEEATDTRNALCNLQWPVNGGRLLMADFVDPQEVKNRVDPPPPSPATPATSIPPATTQPPQPSPRLQVQKQQLPPPPILLPPPPAREHALPPPPPPPSEKAEPPIVTLDDLFKKTRATPRIYYLPLSDEEVAAKLNPEGKPVIKQ